MADTAIPTSEIANQRREHLPRQQPHKALKPIQSFSMGPHPGPTPIARVNSVGGGGSSVAQQQSRSLQHKASYLQQRATGTNQENVFKANIPPPPVVPANTEHRHRQHQQAMPTTHSYRNSSGRRMVGPYQLSKTIGAGSMGKVKVAVDTRSNKRVSIVSCCFDFFFVSSNVLLILPWPAALTQVLKRSCGIFFVEHV